jgi:drug/metabolite transporter (DMT)-like permease
MVKPQLEAGPFLWVVTIRLSGGVLAMLALVAWRRQWRSLLVTYQQPHPWKLTLWACFLGGFVGSLLWLGGYTLIPASEASVYNEAQLIFMVLFAWWFLKEPVDLRKILGVLLTLGGVLVMLLV